ncbi:protein RIC-3 isoform X3 [Equus asinus]|uniref:protein RIC-3 isoform X3 n=1 Tax=Equus asinus TaxID=9793 RepID=UPI0038F6FDFC
MLFSFAWVPPDPHSTHTYFNSCLSYRSQLRHHFLSHSLPEPRTWLGVPPVCSHTTQVCQLLAQTVTSDQEKRLLHQLREITRVMKEGKFIDRPTPEKEAEEAPYMEDWEGYPEETYPVYDLSDCIKRRQETILVDYPDPQEPSAEEIAERMGVLEEAAADHLGWEMPTDPRAQEENSFTSCDPKPETCSCCFPEEEDPAVLAENAGFSADSYSEQEEAAKEVWPQDFRDEGLGISADKAYTGGTLRKRNPQGLE